MHIGTGNQGPDLSHEIQHIRGQELKIVEVLDKPDRVVPPHLITSNLVRQCL